jgi:hypothetical protein
MCPYLRLSFSLSISFLSRTYFSEEEIERLYIRWTDELKGDLNENGVRVAGEGVIPVIRVLELEELQRNPFKWRIGRVFAKSKQANEGEGNERAVKVKAKNRAVHDEEKCKQLQIDFEGFVTLANVFSPRCDLNRKAEYAFKIYDFDGDEKILEGDVQEIIRCTIGAHEVSKAQLSELAAAVLKEADDDGEDGLTLFEFRRLVKRIPEFMTR